MERNDTTRVLAPPGACEYLPGQTWRMEYEFAPFLSKRQYSTRLIEGWRRFGDTMFRPRCRSCDACRSLRVIVDRFQPDRSQRRAFKKNSTTTNVSIGEPILDATRLALYQRFHAHRETTRGWRGSEADRESEIDAYVSTFVNNPFPTSEWRFEIDDRLIGVGLVDDLPIGLSAIYLMHDPEFLDRSIGTFNVLCLIEEARRRGLPHVYLGYHVGGCRSLDYKARFRPHEFLDAEGVWREPTTPNS